MHKRFALPTMEEYAMQCNEAYGYMRVHTAHRR